MIRKYLYYIGIDTGVNTGLTVWKTQTREIISIDSMAIHKAMEIVKFWHTAWPTETFVRVEDARLATFGRQKDIHKAKGAGSVIRDAKIWDDYLKDLGVPYEMCRPVKSLTKISADHFQKITKWQGLTNEHSRDACMLVFGI